MVGTMNWQWTPASSVLFLSAALAIGTAVGLFRRRAIPGAAKLAGTMLAGAWWSLAAGLEATARAMEAKILFSTLEYVGSGSLAVLFLLFAFDYTGHAAGLPARRRALLGIVPLVAVLLVATNGLHRWVWTAVSPGPTDLNSIIYHHGPAFFAILAALILCVVTAAVLLGLSAVRGSAVQRRQSALVLLASAFPVVGSILYALGQTPVPGLNLTPVSFVLSGAVLAIGIVPLRLFELVPVARAALIERMNDGVLVIDSTERIVDSNLAARQLVGVSAKDTGLRAGAVLPMWDTIAPHLRPDRDSHFELTVSETPLVHLDFRVAPLRRTLGTTAGYLIVIRDISDRYRAERLLHSANDQLQTQVREIQRLQEELRDQAVRDALTGLFNRRHLDDILPRVLDRATRDETEVVVIAFDIDHFKAINDLHGHETGDALLRALSTELRRYSRPGDVACRPGGDEIVLILPGSSTAGAAHRAEAIRRALREGSLIGLDPSVRVTVSVGIAAFPRNGDTPGEVLRAADRALYEAKRAGRDCVRVADSRVQGVR